MSEENKNVNDETILENFKQLAKLEGIQRYILGTKKNGQPRALYDIITDFVPTKNKKKKKKKKDKDKEVNQFNFYKSYKRKKKKKKKKGKYLKIR